MRKTSTLQSAQALALAAVCAIEVGASGLVQAQAAPAPAQPPPAAEPTPPPTAAAPVAQPTAEAPATAPDAPEAAPEAAAEPAPPADPNAPAVPEAAEPTAPPAYVESVEPPVEATIEPAPVIDEELTVEPKSKVPSYVMWAVGGASLITGTVLGISALTAKSDFDDNPSYEAADKVEGRAVAADVALGLSAVLLITGTVFYFLPDSQEARPTAQNSKRPTARWQVAPLLGRTNGGALSIQF